MPDSAAGQAFFLFFSPSGIVVGFCESRRKKPLTVSDGGHLGAVMCHEQGSSFACYGSRLILARPRVLLSRCACTPSNKGVGNVQRALLEASWQARRIGDGIHRSAITCFVLPSRLACGSAYLGAAGMAWACICSRLARRTLDPPAAASPFW